MEQIDSKTDVSAKKQQQLHYICVTGQKYSLCRFYLRGICPLLSQQCKFSHGINDLVYHKCQSNQKIHYQFTGECCQFYQLDGHDVDEKVHKNYQTLLIFSQQNKGWLIQQKLNIPEQITLQYLSNSRQLRKQLRTALHKWQFGQFMKMLQKQYNYESYLFEVDFIKKQYYRLGFNKLMTKIKFGHLDFYLSNKQNGYYKYNTAIVPEAIHRRKNFYLKKASHIEIIKEYKQLLIKFLKQKSNEGTKVASQEDIKQYLLSVPRNWRHIPPINQILTDLHKNLRNWINEQQLLQDIGQMIKQGQLPQIKSEQQLIQKLIIDIVRQSLDNNGYCIIQQQIYQTLMGLKFNNKTLIKKILKRCLQQYKDKVKSFKVSLIGEIIINLYKLKPQPRNSYDLQMSSNFKRLSNILYQKVYNDKTSQQQPIIQKLQTNHHQEVISDQNIIENGISSFGKVYKLKNKHHIYFIQTAKQLLQHYSAIQLVSIVSIDLQGALHNIDSGYIALIQLYFPQNNKILIIDCHQMKINNDHSSIQTVSSLMMWILLNNAIVKIFHDCRGDLNALLFLLPHKIAEQQNEGILAIILQLKNIFDTSIADIIIQQLKYSKTGQINTPALNTVLERYCQGDNINLLKNKYHSIWQQGNRDPACQRPIHKQFIEYCAMDVLGLPEAHKKMCQLISQNLVLQICKRSIIKFLSKKT